jgi:hypothetical protein
MLRTRLTLLALIGAVLTTTAAFAQEAAPRERPCQAEVRFSDGSLVRMNILQENIEIQTRYGKLTVPLGEVRRIEFGLHVPGEVDQQIHQSIKLLGSDVFKERDVATRDLLQVGHWARPSLQRASRSSDQEVAHRAASLLRQLTDRVPPELLRLKDEDVIHTAEFTIVGRLVAPTLKAQSPHFGELALKLADLRTLHLRHQGGSLELMVDAAKFGSEVEQWFDTGVVVDPSLRLCVCGEGQIDLWPQGPGQYMASPKGFNTTGKGGNFMAGALVGRIGEHGKAFMIGDRYEGTPAEEGKLYLHIVPSPWNNASTGNFRVRVQAENLALSAR